MHTLYNKSNLVYLPLELFSYKSKNIGNGLFISCRLALSIFKEARCLSSDALSDKLPSKCNTLDL